MSLLLTRRMQLKDVTIFEDSENFAERAAAINPCPELVFLDIQVRPHDGFKMLEILRQLPGYKGVPVIALTASVMNEEVARLRQAGFDGCLAKPIEQETFPEMIEAILAGETLWRILN
jgi:CheY-like chemotaxis protein